MQILIVTLFLMFPLWINAAEVSLQDGNVRFVAPEGFRALSAEEISTKFPRGNSPSVVYANADSSVSIAVTFSSTKVSRSQLPEMKASMEQTLPRLVPNLRWLRREVIVSNNTPWVHLELTSSAIDTDIHNHMYLTSYHGHMLGFNFNSTVAAFPRYAKALSESFKTIRISE